MRPVDAEPGQRQCDEEQRACGAGEHERLEHPPIAGVGVGEKRRDHEDGQRAGRVLDAEVRVRHVTVLHAIAVALVDRQVADLVAREEELGMHEAPRHREDDEGGRGRQGLTAGH